MTGSHEVRGSIPLSSTKNIKDLRVAVEYSNTPILQQPYSNPVNSPVP